jgi:hypothetical protein
VLCLSFSAGGLPVARENDFNFFFKINFRQDRKDEDKDEGKVKTKTKIEIVFPNYMQSPAEKQRQQCLYG